MTKYLTHAAAALYAIALLLIHTTGPPAPITLADAPPPQTLLASIAPFTPGGAAIDVYISPFITPQAWPMPQMAPQEATPSAQASARVSPTAALPSATVLAPLRRPLLGRLRVCDAGVNTHTEKLHPRRIIRHYSMARRRRHT